MSRPTIIKLVLLVVGIAVFAFGVREADSRIRWAGIGFLAAAFLLRLVTGRPRGRESHGDREPPIDG